MRFYVLLAVLIIVHASCSSERDEIPVLEVGSDFTDSNIRVITIDTFKVELSTFKFDSLNTSSSNRLLVGQYLDDFFGQIRASNYFELTANSYTISEDAELDSVGLILGYDNYFYNDTIPSSRLNVHLLKEEVNPEDEIFYNVNTLEYEQNPIAVLDYQPEPRDDDSLYIALPFEFGNMIFKGIQDNDINDDDDLREALKGISLQPGENDNSSIIGFSRNAGQTYLRFFFKEKNEEEEEKTFDLFIKSDGPRAFNNLRSDVSNLPLDTLIDQEINLLSSKTNNQSFIQAGIGYATRIQFPTLKDIYDIPGTGTVLSAVLQIKPPRSSYSDLQPIRDSLNVNIVDQNNRITEQVTNGGGAVYGRINDKNSEFNEVIYEIPVGIYVDRKLLEPFTIDDALILYQENYNSTVDRIILNDSQNSDFNAKLIIKYAIYDED
ncbi:DUF4270 family protein [Flavobacteriaceae bacterium M23B6Z8]